MTDAFIRTGPLMDATSYPLWAQRLLQECSASKRRVVEHEFYQRMRDGNLGSQTMRQYLIGGWPVVEQFSVYMAHNLTKTRYARHRPSLVELRPVMRSPCRLLGQKSFQHRHEQVLHACRFQDPHGLVRTVVEWGISQD